MTWKLQGRSQIMMHDETLFRLIFSNAQYVDGKLTKIPSGREPFRGNVQPLSGRELLLVPEHQRFLEQYWVYTQERILEKSGEIVERACVNYQVQSIEYWGSFQKIRITRVDVGKNDNP